MSQLQDFPACNPDIAQLDWRCGPCGLTRDSDTLESANFDEALEQLCHDSFDGDVEIIEFRHWACGWIQEIFTRPGSPAEALALKLREQLDTYPCLNEERLARYEAEEDERIAKYYAEQESENADL